MLKRRLLRQSLRAFRALRRTGRRATLRARALVMPSPAGVTRPVGPVASAVSQATDALGASLLEAQIAELERLADTSGAPGSYEAATSSAPRVSVIMPTWNRIALLPAAIASVRAQTYPHWELLVADDGSTDDTAPVVQALAAAEPRIRYLPDEHAGQAAARNRALAHASGDIVAYLDSDTVWYPAFLAEVVTGFEQHPEVECLYLAQLVINRTLPAAAIRCEQFDASRLAEHNFIDLNVFAHRRRCLEKHGGFDERLTRLVDYDLIRRYTKHLPPLRVDKLGGRYEESSPGSVTHRENLQHNAYLIQRKWERPISKPLRVLYALWHYPQLSESYARAEIDYMRRRGVEIEVWSELDSCPAPFKSDVPVHYGALAGAIARFKPDVVHVHWSNRAELYADAVADAGLPMTIRDHAFDYTARLIERLVDDDVVKRIYVFPHLVAQLARRPRQVRALPVAFNGDLCPPSTRKDRRLILRTAAALRTKDLPTFFQAAVRCPEHEFVAVLVVCAGEEAYAEEIKAYNRSLGSPVDLRINLQAEDVAELTARAGIYLHTHGLVTPYGMPISIAESMATGCYVIGRRCSGSQSYIGDAGALYDTLDQAVALIQDTCTWSDERWQSVRLAAIDRAYGEYVDSMVLPPMLEDWLALAHGASVRSTSAPPRPSRP